MNTEQSAQLFDRACASIPGGVNSPVRAFGSVGGHPLYMESGSGSRIKDVDGNEYVDFCGSWGPLVLGHSQPDVLKAVCETAAQGLSFGTCCPNEVEFAELFKELVPSCEMVRCVNSGTEAVMTALRLARGVTGRNLIVKFNGCYHGHSDSLLIAAGSGLLTQSIASSKGVTEALVSEIITADYNDDTKIEQIFTEYGQDIAAVIIEPLAGNMGMIKPRKEFLQLLRDRCDATGAQLIFDEVITGFRFHAGAYAELIGIQPDIMTFGKIIGGGMPIGAVASSRANMEQLAPLGGIYQAGTLSGNPVALAAGITMLKLLRDQAPYAEMERLAEIFCTTVNKAATGKGAHCARHRSVFTLFFTDKQPLQNLTDVQGCDTAAFARYHRHMLEAGFYLSPSQFELNFISAAHCETKVRAAAEAAAAFFK